MYCQNCGQEVPAESNFCIHCGHALKDEEQAAATSSRLNQAGAKFSQVSQDLINRVDRVTGGSGQVKIKFSDLFTEIGKRHQRDEVDEIFTAGSRLTTPAPEDISKEWPRPWYYSRIFIVLMVVALALYVVTVNMDNMITLPALLLVGASVTVLPVVSFFFECNSPRNISLITVFEIFAVGGAFSILATMFIFLFTDGIAVNSESMLSILLAVIAEEVAKAFLTLYFIRRYADKRYILNGLLIGAGVGAGFAVFETAGYGFYELMETGYYESLVNILVMRGVMAIGGHVVWAAIQGGALMLALKAMGVNFSWAALKEPAFLRFAGLTILMHFIWNSNLFILPLPIIMDLKYILLIIFAWLVIFILVNRGIKEINQITLDYQPTEPTASGVTDESVGKQIID